MMWYNVPKWSGRLIGGISRFGRGCVCVLWGLCGCDMLLMLESGSS